MKSQKVDRRKQLLEELGTLCSEHFKKRDFFACAYGSFAYGADSKLSDLDFFIATEKPTLSDRVTLEKTVRAFFKRHSLRVDNEVPYHNKLVVSYLDVENAVSLRPLTDGEGRISIAPVRKNKRFLSSVSIRERLLFNALTTPHDCFAGNSLTYRFYRIRAERALLKLTKKLLALEKGGDRKPLDVVTVSQSGASGEMYLGYKPERPQVKMYLQKIFRRL